MKTIRYSVDSAAFDKTFPFTHPKPGQSAYELDTSAAVYLTLPRQAKSVSIQLEYTDGTLSEVKQFAKE